MNYHDKAVVIVRLAHLAQSMHKTILADLASKKASPLMRSVCTEQLSVLWEFKPVCFERVGFSDEALYCIDLLQEVFTELRGLNRRLHPKFVLGLSPELLDESVESYQQLQRKLFGAACVMGLL